MYNQSIPRIKGLESGSLSSREVRRSREGKEPCHTAIEIAKDLGISISTLSRWVAEGNFPVPDFYASSTVKRYWRRTPALNALISGLRK